MFLSLMMTPLFAGAARDSDVDRGVTRSVAAKIVPCSEYNLVTRLPRFGASSFAEVILMDTIPTPKALLHPVKARLAYA
jgi:hypothetical protein